VASLRKALGDARQSPLYIETVTRWGYRFVGDVETIAAHDPGADLHRAGQTRAAFDSGP
jgi:DNA-binding winged helix-turn-helix (wHTH) protein